MVAPKSSSDAHMRMSGPDAACQPANVARLTSPSNRAASRLSTNSMMSEEPFHTCDGLHDVVQPSKACMVLNDAYQSGAGIASRSGVLPACFAQCNMPSGQIKQTRFEEFDGRHSCCDDLLNAPFLTARPSPATSQSAALRGCAACTVEASEAFWYCRHLSTVIQITINTSQCCFPIPLFSKRVPGRSGTFAPAQKRSYARTQARPQWSSTAHTAPC